jgi:hypothetical protein
MGSNQVKEQFLKGVEEHFPKVVFSETASMNRVNKTFKGYADLYRLSWEFSPA